ncbi:MAG: hypothetical protein CM15mP21_5650 [Hyphomicrobiales bacterium]|nr:MAG: hypothetical protein CM15mP21_5650 [Hyphomicrobiales bacterium]
MAREKIQWGKQKFLFCRGGGLDWGPGFFSSDGGQGAGWQDTPEIGPPAFDAKTPTVFFFAGGPGVLGAWEKNGARENAARKILCRNFGLGHIRRDDMVQPRGKARGAAKWGLKNPWGCPLIYINPPRHLHAQIWGN